MHVQVRPSKVAKSSYNPPHFSTSKPRATGPDRGFEQFHITSKGGVEGAAGAANAVPICLTVWRCRTTILVDCTVHN